MVRKSKSERRQAQNEAAAVRASTNGGIEPPFPQAPKSKGNPYCIYITHEDTGHLNAIPIRARYAGHALIQQIIKQQGEFDYHKGDLLFETGWRISTRGDHVSAEQLNQYEPSARESEWEFPPHMLPRCAFPKRAQEPAPLPAAKPKTQKTERTPRPPKDPTAITAEQIANELGVSPSKARQAIRGKIDKPDGGWSWPKDHADLPKVRKLIEKAGK